MPALAPDEAWRRLGAARIAYLATVRADGRPHVVPALWWVRADGVARVAADGAERDTAIRLLRAKYPQYESWTTPFGAATVVTVERLTSWALG